MAIDPRLVSIKKVSDIPTVPLSELQTGQMFGYTGDGDLKKVATNDLLGFIKSGIKGIATQANAPTPYDAVTYPDGLFETYVVRTPLTMPNSWGSEVTQAELDANFVYFDVKNGVVSKEVSFKNNEIADGQVSTEKTDFAVSDTFPVGANILNPDKVTEDKRVHPVTGLPFDSISFDAIFYTRVKPNIPYSFKGIYDLAWFDKDKNLISVGFASTTITSPSGSAYMSISYGKGEIEQIVREGVFSPVPYEPFVGVSGVKIQDFINDNIFKVGDDVYLGDRTTKKIITHSEFINNGLRMFVEGGNQNFFSAGAGPLVMPTGQSNFGSGTEALSKVTTGVANYGSGAFALRDLIDGADNTATGVGSMQKLQGGVGNTSSGRLSLANLINNGHNSAYGDTCYERLEDGGNNTGSGYGCAIGLKQGDNNSLFGTYAGGHPNGGVPSRTPTAIWSNNSGVGAFSMQYNEISSNNSYVGKGAFFNLVSGDGYNVGIGTEVFYDGVSIAFDTGVGNKAGSRLVSGINNVFVGNRCGGEIGQKTDAIGTTVIGHSAISTRNNEVVIGKNTDTHVTIAGVEFTKAQIIALKALV